MLARTKQRTQMAVAEVLARSRAHKMQWAANLAFVMNRKAYRPSPGQLAADTEPAECNHLMNTNLCENVQERRREIRALWS